MHVLSAAVNAYFFATWKRVDADLKSRVWRRYGWFTALSFVGSVSGLATAAADIQFRYNYNRIAIALSYDRCIQIKLDTDAHILAKLDCYSKELVTPFMQMLYWLSVSPVPYAIEFLCVCCANLLVRLEFYLLLVTSRISCSSFLHLDQVIERMVDFIVKGQLGGRWFSISARVAMLSVTILNTANAIFMAIFSHFSFQGLPSYSPPKFVFQLFAGSSILNPLVAKLQNPDLQDIFQDFFICFFDLASPECSVSSISNAAFDKVSKGLNFAGYGSICEGSSLVIILVSFVVAGVLCIRRFYTGSTIRTTAVGRRNSNVRRQIFVTVITVFATFLIRCLYAAILALSRTTASIHTPFDSRDRRCNNLTADSSVCSSCQELGLIVQACLWLSPWFSFTVFLLASPVTTLVALWGMTTDNLVQSLGWKWSGCFRKKKANFGGSMKSSFIQAGGEV
jgi:hypothetical protein